VVVARSLTVLALLPLAALAQKPVPVRLDIPSVKKAVVTIHALDASGEAVASGTGFFVTGGSVVTAAHVLQGAASCSVELSDGQTMRCSVAASDTGKDVVMLLVGGQPPATLRWGTSDDAKDGDEITVVSNPLGELPGTVSKGIVSASRVVSGTKLIQISAAISHGSSGAPVLDSHGQVIGIVRSTISEGQSLNFATATDAVRYMLNSPSAVAEAQGFFSKPAAAPAAPVASVAPATGGQGRRTIQVGQTVNSTLSSSDDSYSDSTYYQRWYFNTRPNTAITLDLASDDFDPVLLLSGLDSTVVDVRHRGPGCAARISLVFPGTGPYSVVANTSVTPVRQIGRYTLSLTQGIKPLLPDDDCTPATGAVASGSSSSPSYGTGTMHQIQVVTIVRHLGGLPWFESYLGDLAATQRLIASATSEVGTGGDMGRSIAAVTAGPDGMCTFEKRAPTVSYGAYADDLFTTLRRSPDTEPGDQVIVLTRKEQATLEQTGTRDPFGMTDVASQTCWRCVEESP